ncbi:tRNA-dihydrouridine synthase [Thalassomonas actiniarum]|uniref:NADH:flavin oxidoreductase n=1 Tax=Thalassomonas actiniarum TaxID=485447 RepID=A0AAF0C2H6_9GAMM|nr:NADH:flavin oxidoreductase [Thalassomonas actiniarum]WDD97855.1 NADH:flavin oxidoreductase [Thalassomonas actiniarum]
MTLEHSVLFSPQKIGAYTLKNRLAIAPMTRVSADKAGLMTTEMARYYQSFAESGFGLIITEGLYTDKRYSQAYRNQPGLSDIQQAKSWQPLLSSLNASGTLLIAQLMHGGALSQYNKYQDHTRGPSAVRPLGQQMPFYYGQGQYPLPEQMTMQDIREVIKGFVSAALFAQSAGFHGVEIHGANGYLLDQFLTPYSNRRSDVYGGLLANRLRLYREILQAVRAAVGDNFIVGVRFSQKKVNDNEHTWPEAIEAAWQTFTLAKNSQVDYIHTTEPQAWAPAFANSPSLAALAKHYSGLPVIANGGIVEGEQALDVIKHQQADIVAIGRAALANPNWVDAIKYGQALRAFDYDLFKPIANLENASRYLDSVS